MPLPTRRLALCAGLLFLTTSLAQAAESAEPTTPATPAKRRKARRRVSSVPRYADGQTPAQRQRSEEARLKRECKGRPNAGACLGYAR